MRIVEVPSDWSSWLRIVADVTPDDLQGHLTTSERADVERLRAPERRLERAASRIAGKILLTETMSLGDAREVEFAKDEDRPFARLRGSAVPLSVSFTHSHGLGAAAVAESPVGIDLERFRDIRPQMTRFFLSPSEFSAAESLDLPWSLLHFWSAKEAAFKMSRTYPTLLKTPLHVTAITSSGLTFEVSGTGAEVETRVVETEFVVALARTRRS